VRQEQRLRRDLDRLLHHGLGRVRDVADEAEPMTNLDHFRAERGQAPMGDGAGLEVADVVGRVVHELQMSDAALMRFLQPLEPAVEKIEPFDVGDECRLCRLVRRDKVGGAKRPAHPVMANDLVHPGEAIEMVPIKLAWFGAAHHGERPLGIPAEDRAIRHVGEACDGKRARPHCIRQIAAWRRLR
jgi:hypothetical protein